jgi:hypothetical protein
MFGARHIAATGSHFGDLRCQVLHLFAQGGRIGLKVGGSGVELGIQN